MGVLSKDRLIVISGWLLIVVYMCFVAYAGYKWGVSTAINLISVPLAALQFVYHKSFIAYLYISKILKILFFSSSKWIFKGEIRDVQYEEFKIPTRKEIQEKILDESIAKLINIKKEQVNKYILSYNHEILFTVEYQTETKKIIFHTNTFTVPDTDYQSVFRTIKEILKIIEPDTGKEKSYELIIQYKENPYYGFYLKKLPREVIKEFSITLLFPSKKANINIRKNKIQISSKDFDYLANSASSILTFSEIP